MRVFGVTGPGVDTVVESLVEGLDGRIAVIKGSVEGVSSDRPPSTVYELSDQGWRATGRDGSLREVLDRLAPAHDYTILESVPEARVPRVVLGDADPPGEHLVAAAEPSALDVDRVVDAVAEIDPHETLTSLVATVKESPQAPYAGAIATFTGRVRAKDHANDEPTEYLEFEKYEGVADERLAALERNLERRDGVHEVLMHHRTGVVEYGEDIVFVVVLAGHRREAFRTVQDGIDRLKEEVPLFKKEVTTDETFWVHDRG